MGRFTVTEIDSENIILNTCGDPSTTYHSHNFIELLYVLNGRASHNLNGKVSTINKGDYLMVDYGASHQYKQQGKEPLQILNCLFLPRLFDEALNNQYSFDKISETNSINFNFHALKGHPTDFTYHDHDGNVGKILKFLLQEYNQKNMGYQEVLRCQLTYILIQSMRRILLPSPEESEHDIAKHIIKYVDKRYSEPISLETFAEKYAYSVSNISKKFKSETGVAFRDYLQTVRIQKSCVLLTTTQKRISEVAEMVGYSDIKFFNTVFKKKTGVSPRQFRKSYSA